MRNLGRCGDAMRYIKQFYDVDSESQDFEWENRGIIKDLKEYCQNQPIYRSINTEHSELQTMDSSLMLAMQMRLFFLSILFEKGMLYFLLSQFISEKI